MEMLKFVAGYLLEIRAKGWQDKLHKASLVENGIILEATLSPFHIQFITKSY